MSMSAGPFISCTKDFQKLQLVFKVVDPEGNGCINCNFADAFKLFGMCRLPQSVLMQILAYTENTINGCLQFSELVQAMHLFYMVQSGHELTSDLLKNAGGPDSFPLPKMEGLDKFLAEEKMKTDIELQQMDTPVLQLSQLMSPLRRSISRSSSKKEKTLSMEPFISEISLTSFAKDMERLNKEKLKPLETEYYFCDFVLPPVLDTFAFAVDPLVMVLGESSTGKTSFIKQLFNCDYPGSEYGTTDRFYFIKVLGYASFVDTPGIRNGLVKTSQYRKIILWCAQKCDMILLFFDPHKPEICAEFKWLLSSLHGHEHKFRIVIYMVDDIDPKEIIKMSSETSSITEARSTI